VKNKLQTINNREVIRTNKAAEEDMKNAAAPIATAPTKIITTRKS